MMVNRVHLVLPLAIVTAILIACSGEPTVAPSQAASQTPAGAPTRAVAVQRATATPAPQPRLAPISQPVTGTESVALTWWTPELLSTEQGQPGAAVLSDALRAFEAQQAIPPINVVLKARYGKGGLLDYLRTAQPVAPSLLPDVITLDLRELEQASATGLLQPLEKLVDATRLSSLYPFAWQAGQIEGHLLAVPIAADFDVWLVNNTQVKKAPATWSDLTGGSASFLFGLANAGTTAGTKPAEDVSNIVLSHYLSAGGSIDGSRHLVLSDEPFVRLLTFYQEARRNGLLPLSGLDSSNPDDTWHIYADGGVSMAGVGARRYLAGKDSLKSSDLQGVPGYNGTAPPMASGWGIAILTPDPRRQKIAAAMIAALLAPDRLGSWTKASGWLPTTPAALATWGDAGYVQFAGGQLQSAVAHPVGSDYPQLAGQMRLALVAVLRDGTNPRDAIVRSQTQGNK
jgi:hypothetical protein